MSNQVQCPNCGGYRVTQAVIPLEENGKPFGEPAKALWRLTQFSTVIMVKIQDFFGIKRNFTLGYESTCLLCGYTWTLREGESPSQVNIRPDLIAKGEQRLREEEERRRSLD